MKASAKEESSKIHRSRPKITATIQNTASAVAQRQAYINGAQQYFVGDRIEILAELRLAAKPARYPAVAEIGKRRAAEQPAAREVMSVRQLKQNDRGH